MDLTVPTNNNITSDLTRSYVVSRLTQEADLDELDRVDTKWADEEGWGTFPGDLLTLRSLTSVARFVGKLDGAIISTISCINYSDTYAFITSFMTKKEYREQGYGRKLFAAALEFAGNRSIGLTCSRGMVDTYARKGFDLKEHGTFYVIKNLERFGKCKDGAVISTLDVPLIELADFDEKYFPARRQNFLQAWIRIPESATLAYMEGSKVRGYGVLTSCSDGTSAKAGPLFADTLEVACALTMSLLSAASQYQNVYFNMLDGNVNAKQFVNHFQMVPMDTNLLLFKNGRPEFDINGVYCITSGLLG